MHVTACEESEDTAFGLLSGTYTNTEAVSTCCESTAHLWEISNNIDQYSTQKQSKTLYIYI